MSRNLAVRPLLAVLPLVLGAGTLASCAPAPTPVAQAPVAPSQAPIVVATTLDALSAGADVQGFVSEALYTDDDGHPRGARFVHARTHFVFDYLQIESAPQAMVYVTTYPTSDDGEPHTQEHLLLGKGNKGRALGNYEHVMLATSNAFTEQYRTVYDFSTMAGADAFWPLFRTELDTFLHPDYTDDEIRREVRDYGISKEADGELALDEKGTVYNEMVRTYEEPSAALWRGTSRLVYGPTHPLAFESGGTPEGIRKLTPADIRTFHQAHYQLANMGAVGAFSPSIPLATVLAQVGEVLDSLAPGASAPAPHFMTAAELPPPAAAPPGTASVVDYPYATADHPGPAALAWPATRHLARDERIALTAFLGAFASGQGSTLYGALVDQKTRTLDVGATGVSSEVDRTLGQPVSIWLENVSPAHADEASLLAVRALVHRELAAIAALPDGSPALAAFGERVKARLVELRRGTDKFLDTPPQFGERETGPAWLDHLADVNEGGAAYRRSLGEGAAYAHALAVAAETKNPWRERLTAWGLLDDPYALMSRASPKERTRLDDERVARTKGELARLTTAYGVSDAKEVLRRREEEIDEVTAALARAEASVPMPPLVSNPPMTKDNPLVWHQRTLRGVPVVASTFDAMKSVTVGLSLRLDSLPEDALPYLAVLPSLLTEVGVLEDGKPIPYDEVADRLRREILDLGVHFHASFTHDRPELELTAAGNDLAEAKHALRWARTILTSPDWRPENLARIRDVVTEESTQLDDEMTTSEERWATRLAATYWRQDRPALEHTQSFLTRAYDSHRLSWMLQTGRDPDAAARASRVARFLGALGAAGKGGDRASLVKLASLLAGTAGAESAPGAGAALSPALAKQVAAAHALPATDQELVKKAGADLGVLLAGVPDDSLAADWASLCTHMAGDLRRPAATTLAALTRTLSALRHASLARAWIVGSGANESALDGDLDGLFASLDPSPAPRAKYAPGDRVLDRVRARGAKASPGVTVALVNPSTGSCTIANSAPSADYDAKGPVLLDFLAASVFSGSGTQSLFKRIWASGLAYNGGIHTSVDGGRLEYYSDRIADAPQLVRLLSGHVRAEGSDPRFVDYAVAKAFYSNVAWSYEDRAAEMAADLADGVTGDRVRAFRERVLALRSSPGLLEAMHARFIPVIGTVLPPLAGQAPPVPGSVHFTIGPDAQLTSYDQELQAEGGSGAKLVKIYARDFWYVGDVAR